jgi:hypothetical protein
VFPPKKKPFPMKPKSADLSDPDPLDEKQMPKAPAKPAMAEEAPEAEEDYGAKLTADLEAVGEQYGLDAETTRKVAAGFFSAAAKCLGGEEPVEHDAGGMSMEGEEE